MTILSWRYYKAMMRILSNYYKDIVSIGGTDTTLPWIDMTSHCHWCVGHPSFTIGKKSPFPLVGRAPHYHWWEGHPIATSGKGISLPLVGRALHCHLVAGASHCHWWQGHPRCHLMERASQLHFRRILQDYHLDILMISWGWCNDIVKMRWGYYEVITWIL